MLAKYQGFAIFRYDHRRTDTRIGEFIAVHPLYSLLLLTLRTRRLQPIYFIAVSLQVIIGATQRII